MPMFLLPMLLALGRHGVSLSRRFVFSVVWAFGGNLREESRPRFDEYIRASGLLHELDPNFPTRGSVYDYCVSTTDGTGPALYYSIRYDTILLYYCAPPLAPPSTPHVRVTINTTKRLKLYYYTILLY